MIFEKMNGLPTAVAKLLAVAETYFVNVGKAEVLLLSKLSMKQKERIVLSSSKLGLQEQSVSYMESLWGSGTL